MAVPSHSILPVAEVDVPILGRLLQASKLQLTINRLLFIDWPDELRQNEVYTGAVRDALADPLHESYKVVHDESGEIVAHLVIARKEGGQTPVPDPHEAQEAPSGMRPEVFSAVMKSLRTIHRDRKGTAHLELVYLNVARFSRRHGIGSQLVRLALDRAKAVALPLFLVAEPAAHGFFLAQGLNDTESVDMDLSKWAPSHSGFGEFRLTGMTTSA